MSTYFHFILLDIKLQIHCQFLMIELDLVPYQGLKQLINDTKYIMLCTTIATPTNINSHQIHPDPDSYLILRIFFKVTYTRVFDKHFIEYKRASMDWYIHIST